MKHKAEITNIRKGDYLELKHAGLDVLYTRIIKIDTHHFFVGLSKIHMKELTSNLGQDGHITWDFEYLQNVLSRIIQSPTEKNMIRLLYD